jgi:hypothetical protein
MRDMVMLAFHLHVLEPHYRDEMRACDAKLAAAREPMLSHGYVLHKKHWVQTGDGDGDDELTASRLDALLREQRKRQRLGASTGSSSSSSSSSDMALPPNVAAAHMQQVAVRRRDLREDLVDLQNNAYVLTGFTPGERYSTSMDTSVRNAYYAVPLSGEACVLFRAGAMQAFRQRSSSDSLVKRMIKSGELTQPRLDEARRLFALYGFKTSACIMRRFMAK